MNEIELLDQADCQDRNRQLEAETATLEAELRQLGIDPGPRPEVPRIEIGETCLEDISVEGLGTVAKTRQKLDATGKPKFRLCVDDIAHNDLLTTHVAKLRVTLSSGRGAFQNPLQAPRYFFPCAPIASIFRSPAFFDGPMNSTMLPSGSLTNTWRRPVGPEITSRFTDRKSVV